MSPFGPVVDGTGRVLDQVRLVGLEARGFHGVLEHERREGQTFRADVTVHLDTRPAAEDDELGKAVDYSVLAEEVAAVLAGTPVDLVETLAERIAAVALANPRVHTVDVTVHKPQAPIRPPFDDVVVSVRRDRSTPPVVGAEDHRRRRPATPEPLEVPSLEPLAAPAPAVPPVPPAAPAAPVVAATPTAPLAVSPGAPVATVPATSPSGEAPRERDRLDERPTEPVEVVIALGSNIGQSQELLRSAVDALAAEPGIEVHAVSPLARTAAVGGPEGQPDFLNAVVLARTTLAPRELLHAAQRIEDEHGRVREVRWGPRTLDVDIVQYGGLVAWADDLELPHPRAHERAFVLLPWAEVDPDAVLGGLGGGPVSQLAATAPDRDGLRWMALDWLSPR